MGDRPGHFVRRTRGRRFAALLALILCAALVDVSVAAAAGRPKPDTVTSTANVKRPDGSTLTLTGVGTIEKHEDGYTVCFPLWAINVEHTFEVKDAKGNVVDTIKFVVPQAPGPANVTIQGKTKQIADVDHTTGVDGTLDEPFVKPAPNQSLSNVCIDPYKAPKPEKK
jgi:hypothetical protein